MTLPSNLSPGEAVQLQRYLNEAKLPDVDTRTAAGETEEGQQVYDPPLYNPDAPSPKISLSPAVESLLLPQGFINLISREGTWRGHDFILSEERHKAILSAVAAQISANLNEEIARLNQEVQ